MAVQQSQSPAMVGETQSTAMAAQAKATIESRYVMALKHPRDWDTVRLKILKDCNRPAFSDSAWYARPVGKKKVGDKYVEQFAEGFSIRFAEAAIRAMGNILPETITVYDDSKKRVMRVLVTDLEDNITYSVDVMFEKTMERSFLKDGQTALSTRVNSYGKPVYVVEADEGALVMKQEALVSKALRKCALRLVPGDILDEAKARVLKVRGDEAAKDPDATRKTLLEAFNNLGISPEMVTAYLGHPPAQLTPAEVEELRGVFVALKEGEKWIAIMESKGETIEEPKKEAGEKPKTLNEVVENSKKGKQ
jgi:hypothetical protein